MKRMQLEVKLSSLDTEKEVRAVLGHIQLTHPNCLKTNKETEEVEFLYKKLKNSELDSLLAYLDKKG